MDVWYDTERYKNNGAKQPFQSNRPRHNQAWKYPILPPTLLCLPLKTWGIWRSIWGLLMTFEGKHRLIHFLLHSRCYSVTIAIDPALCRVKHAFFDVAAAMIRKLGHAALLAKCIIKSAFWILPVHPEYFDLLGFALRVHFMISCSAWSAPVLLHFECFSKYLEWYLHINSGHCNFTYYLDDFVLTDAPNSGEGYFVELRAELRVSLAEEKTEGLVTVFTFLVTDSIPNWPWGKLDVLHPMMITVAQEREGEHVNFRFCCSTWSMPGGLWQRFCAGMYVATA